MTDLGPADSSAEGHSDVSTTPSVPQPDSSGTHQDSAAKAIDPAVAATAAAGVAWLAGKGVHLLRKRRIKRTGGARTKVGGKLSNVIWTAAAAIVAALVEVVIARLIRRRRP